MSAYPVDDIEQILRIDRLDQGSESAITVALCKLGLAGGEDDRRPSAAELGRDLAAGPTVEKIDVHKGAVAVPIPDQLSGFVCRGCRPEDFVVAVPEFVLEHHGDQGIVFDDQNLHALVPVG